MRNQRQIVEKRLNEEKFKILMVIYLVFKMCRSSSKRKKKPSKRTILAFSATPSKTTPKPHSTILIILQKNP
jgi:hypothetical protein